MMHNITHQQQLDHFLMLYDSAAFGPDYARWAVREYLQAPFVEWPKMGFEIKEVLDGRVTAEAT